MQKNYKKLDNVFNKNKLLILDRIALQKRCMSTNRNRKKTITVVMSKKVMDKYETYGKSFFWKCRHRYIPSFYSYLKTKMIPIKKSLRQKLISSKYYSKFIESTVYRKFTHSTFYKKSIKEMKDKRLKYKKKKLDLYNKVKEYFRHKKYLMKKFRYVFKEKFRTMYYKIKAGYSLNKFNIYILKQKNSKKLIGRKIKKKVLNTKLNTFLNKEVLKIKFKKLLDKELLKKKLKEFLKEKSPKKKLKEFLTKKRHIPKSKSIIGIFKTINFENIKIFKNKLITKVKIKCKKKSFWCKYFILFVLLPAVYFYFKVVGKIIIVFEDIPLNLYCNIYEYKLCQHYLVAPFYKSYKYNFTDSFMYFITYDPGASLENGLRPINYYRGLLPTFITKDADWLPCLAQYPKEIHYKCYNMGFLNHSRYYITKFLNFYAFFQTRCMVSVVSYICFTTPNGTFEYYIRYWMTFMWYMFYYIKIMSPVYLIYVDMYSYYMTLLVLKIISSIAAALKFLYFTVVLEYAEVLRIHFYGLDYMKSKMLYARIIKKYYLGLPTEEDYRNYISTQKFLIYYQWYIIKKFIIDIKYYQIIAYINTTPTYMNMTLIFILNAIKVSVYVLTIIHAEARGFSLDQTIYELIPYLYYANYEKASRMYFYLYPLMIVSNYIAGYFIYILRYILFVIVHLPHYAMIFQSAYAEFYKSSISTESFFTLTNDTALSIQDLTVFTFSDVYSTSYKAVYDIMKSSTIADPTVVIYSSLWVTILLFIGLYQNVYFMNFKVTSTFTWLIKELTKGESLMFYRFLITLNVFCFTGSYLHHNQHFKSGIILGDLGQITIIVDSLSSILVMITALTFNILYIYILTNYSGKRNMLVILFISLELLLYVCFLTQNILTFYICFEATLIPLTLILLKYGSRQRKSYATKYLFIYTAAGSLFFLIAICIIFCNTGSFNFSDIYLSNYSFTTQKILWLLFFISFAVKMPTYPFHLWLPEAHVEAPTFGSVLLASLLLKLGGYGFIRFSLKIAPEACVYYQPFVYTLGLISIIYASFCAIRQTDLKRIIAYTSIAHMNLCLIGIFSLTPVGLYGAIYLMFGHAFVSSALFILVGYLYDQFGTRSIYYYGGLMEVMPVFSHFFLLFNFANMGFPGMVNFIGELLIMIGLAQHNILVLLISGIGFLLSAIYSVWLINRVIYGNIKINYLTKCTDVNDSNLMVVLMVLLVLTIFYGLTTPLMMKGIENVAYYYTIDFYKHIK